MTEVSLAAERIEVDSVEEGHMAGPLGQGEDMGNSGENGSDHDHAKKACADTEPD